MLLKMLNLVVNQSITYLGPTLTESGRPLSETGAAATAWPASQPPVRAAVVVAAVVVAANMADGTAM